MHSDAQTIDQYLAELPNDRREAIETVRQAILDNLPDGYQEVMNWGMIAYEVPLETYPDTYNKKPLMYAALASQKNHMAVYLSGIYMLEDHRETFEEAYRATGKKYDVGKSCVRFKKFDDLPVELIGRTIGALEVEDFVGKVKAARAPRG